MADRYWVGGSASWDATAGTKWALTSGGAGGEAVPTASDDVFFDANSGAVTVTIPGFGTGNGLNVNFTGFTGTFAMFTSTLNVAGSLTLGTSMTLSQTGGSSSINFTGTGTHTITSAGKSFNGPVAFTGTGGTWTLQDDFVNLISLVHTRGTFNANGFDVTINNFDSNNSNTRTLTMGSGQWTLTGNASNIWHTSTTTGLTLSYGGVPVKCTYSGSTGTRVIVGAGTANISLGVSYEIVAGTDSVNVSQCLLDLDFTGFSGVFSGTTQLLMFGNITFSAGMTSTNSANLFMLAPGAVNITCNGVATSSRFIFGSSAFQSGVFNLTDTFINTHITSPAFQYGTFNSNNFNLTCLGFSFPTNTTMTVNMGSSTWEATEIGTRWNLTGLTTINAGTSTIKFTDSSSTFKTFAGAGKTYHNVWFSGNGTGVFNITGSNTFNTITLDTPPHYLTFANGSTTTVTNLSVDGTTEDFNELSGPTLSSAWSISKSSGEMIVNNMRIENSTAIGGATWVARHSTDLGGNSGWKFLSNPLKNVSTISNTTKNLATFTNQSKNVATISNIAKTVSTWGNASKVASTWANQTKI